MELLYYLDASGGGCLGKSEVKKRPKREEVNRARRASNAAVICLSLSDWNVMWGCGERSRAGFSLEK